MQNVNYELLFEKAARLVADKITGTRKGMPDKENFRHSFRVANLLKVYGFKEEVCIAGLLHDVIEDGGMQSYELRKLFPSNIIDLVELSTHDLAVPHKDRRWVLMVAQLTKADSSDAFAIKLADVFDNLMDAHMLPKEREMFMREVKAPALLYLSEHLLKSTPLWQDLNKVTLTITQRIGEIGGIIMFIRHELKSLKLSEENENTLLELCNKVDDLNYGSYSERLFKSIEKLHDAMENVANKGQEQNSQLIVLANGLCGDMLKHLDIGKSVQGHYRSIQQQLGM
jgi:hypothetical protein